MSTRTLGKVILRKAPYGFDECIPMQEAAGQSFKIGQFLKLNAGQVAVCTDAADEQFHSLAMQDASGTQGTVLKVQRLTPLHVLSMSSYHATAATSATLISHIGKDAPIIQTVTANEVYIDEANMNTGATSTNPFMVIGIDPINEVGDVYGRYLVCLKATNCQSWTA